VPHQCHLCAARFNDDNSFAEHCVRHRDFSQYGNGDSWRTNQRQARRAMIEDLKEILDATA
jgi:hypothetical protein